MRAAQFTQSSDILSNELSASAFVRVYVCDSDYWYFASRNPQKKLIWFFHVTRWIWNLNRPIFLIIIFCIFGFGFNFIYLLDSIMNGVRLNEFAENRMPFIDV